MILEQRAQRSGKLLSFLRRELGLSTTMVNRLKQRDAMFVNGRPVHTDHPVAAGDRISVCIEEPEPEYPAEEGPLSILYEDEAVLALDKPAGLMMHPSRSRNTGTLANRVAWYYRETGQLCAFHPVSRLDRDTFGVVLLAKNGHTHARLCAAHQAGELEKVYLAAVWGAPPEEAGTIDRPIARLDSRGLLRGVRADGQRAVTDYRVLLRAAQGALVELHPRTGRTHQLRVHMADLGCPILGDPQYGSTASQAWSLAHGLAVQQLCAVSLTFPHPLRAERVRIESRQGVLLPETDEIWAASILNGRLNLEKLPFSTNS